MLKLPSAVLSAVLAASFSHLAAAQSATATSPNNPAATPGVEKDAARGATAPNRRSPNNPAATPNARKDDSQHGFVNDNAAAGSTSSPNNPAATPDRKRRQEQR